MTDDERYELQERIGILTDALEAAVDYITALQQKIKDMEAAGMRAGRPPEEK